MFEVGQSEGRAQEGFQKARPLPNLTPSHLNVFNVHCRVFKAYPLVRAAMCLDKSLEGNDKSLEGHGGPSGGVPPLCEDPGKLALRHRGGAERRAGAWVPWELRPYDRSRCAEHGAF